MNEAGIDRFIEESGVRLELDAGAPRMVGRVLGWLLVCDPAEQSAAEIAERLQASKGSISTATRVLLTIGLVERVRLPGERFDRFRARPEVWDEFLWREEQFTEPRRVFKLGLDALPAQHPARERLEELDAMHAWWAERIPKLREEYLRDRRRARREREKGKQ